MAEGVRQMRYQRGVPLTAEERGGGGEGAGRGWRPDMSNQFAEPGGYGFNPQAGGGGGYGFGGGLDLGALLGFGGGGGGGTPQAGGGANANQQALLQGLMEIWRKQAYTPEDVFTARRKTQDPVGWASKQRDARLAGDPWAEGGILAGRNKLWPAAALASQGGNAMNQWAQRGGVEGIDPKELARLNAMAAGRYKTYM